MERVLVTGATGIIGRVLVKKLVDMGCQVRAFVRSGSSLSGLPQEVSFFTGDLLSEKDLNEACAGIDTVFHLAAKLHINNPTPSDEKEIFKVNLEATRLLCRAAWQNKIDRFIFFSTINVYGSSDQGLPFNEDSPLNPKSAYSRSKLEAEKIVLDLTHKKNGLPVGVVLRLASVFGPSMKGNYRLLLFLAKKGFRILPGDLKNRRTLVHEKDAVEAAIISALHKRSAGKIFNVSDGSIYNLESIYCSILEQYGRKTYVKKIPIFVIWPFCRVMDLFCGFLHLSKPFVSGLTKFTEDMAVDGSLFMRITGFQPEKLFRRE